MQDSEISWRIALLVCCFYNFTLSSCYGAPDQENRYVPALTSGVNRNLGGDIPINIRLTPAHFLHGKNYVSTSENLTALAEILDSKFRNVTLTYQWSVKNQTIITNNTASQISHRFSTPDDYQFLELLVFHPQNDTGTCRKDLVIRHPVSIADPIGKLFLERGELLDITFKFSGTGPFRYCQKICHNRYEPGCGPCKPDSVTPANQVPVLKYLRRIGNYTLYFAVDNIASSETKSYAVKITDIIRPQSIPYIPIISSISAVIILLVGVALHMKFKRSIYTETADFNFTRQAYDDLDEVWDREQSLLQRVRYIFFHADRSGSNAGLSDSNLSSSRTRLF